MSKKLDDIEEPNKEQLELEMVSELMQIVNAYGSQGMTRGRIIGILESIKLHVWCSKKKE